MVAVCQTLRILSFSVTQLPAPNYHCHLGKPTSVREWPQHWWEHLVVNLGRQVSPHKMLYSHVIGRMHTVLECNLVSG